MCSLYSIWMGLVAINTWMRFCAALDSACAAASMSPGTQRAREQITLPRTVSEMAEMALKSPLDEAANPASITSTPRSSRARAISTFSFS